jgi:hypothetical protein
VRHANDRTVDQLAGVLQDISASSGNTVSATANAREILGKNEEKARKVSLDTRFSRAIKPVFRILHKNTYFPQ